MYLKLPKNVSLENLYLEEDQTIWFLIWILRKSGCDRYVSEIILEYPFQVIQDNCWGYFRQYIRKNRHPHGLEREWYSNGQLMRERHFKNGQLRDLARGWYINGHKMYEENWKNDKRDGLKRRWDEDGQLISEIITRKGFDISKSIFNNGKLTTCRFD